MKKAAALHRRMRSQVENFVYLDNIVLELDKDFDVKSQRKVLTDEDIKPREDDWLVTFYKRGIIVNVLKYLPPAELLEI